MKRSKRVVKIFKNTRSIGSLRLKNKEITKFSLVFQFQFGYFSLFCKTSVLFSIAWKDGSFDAHIDIFWEEKKKTLTNVFFTPRPFAMVNIDFRILELKDTLRITTWNWFLSKLWKIFHPLCALSIGHVLLLYTMEPGVENIAYSSF